MFTPVGGGLGEQVATHRSRESSKLSTAWKSLVDPDSNLFKYSINEGFAAFMHRPTMRTDNRTCAFVSHMRNAVRGRVTSFKNMDHDTTDWLWPLRNSTRSRRYRKKTRGRRLNVQQSIY